LTWISATCQILKNHKNGKTGYENIQNTTTKNKNKTKITKTDGYLILNAQSTMADYGREVKRGKKEEEKRLNETLHTTIKRAHDQTS